MNCLACELRRARLYAMARAIVGTPTDRVAAALSAKYGERYYVQGAHIMRASKIAPYQPHKVT